MLIEIHRLAYFEYFLPSIILNSKHEKIIVNNQDLFSVYIQATVPRNVWMYVNGKKSWLFPTFFLCLTSKFIDVRN